MTVLVYSMPNMPRSEKGTKLRSDFNKQSGNNIHVVTESKAVVRETEMLNKDCKMAGMVSAKIME